MSDSGTRRFGRFTVVATLGTGAMGEVLRARDERLGREVAIKTIRNVFGLRVDDFRTRFEAEARALAALSHPAIVQVHDLGFDDASGEPYLVMELVDGPSLKTKLEGGPMDAAAVRALGIQLARALEAAHARGILHRDVKPANLILAPSGQWKLADFGVAHVPDSSMTMTGQFLGTPAYAAPEALVLGQFSDKSDVFGAAATLVEAASGTRLRGDSNLSEIVQSSAESVQVPPSVPADLADVLRRALARDPAARPTAAQLAELLAGGHAPVVTAAPTLMPARPRAPMPRSWLYGGAIGLVLVIGLVAALSRGDGASATKRAPDQVAPAPAPAPSPSATATEPVSGPPDSQRISAPGGLDDHGLKDWQHLADAFNHGNYDDAAKKLDKFEDRYGESPATQQLRQLLDAAGAQPDDEDEDRPGPPGKHHPD